MFGNLLASGEDHAGETLMLIYLVPCTELIELRDAYMRSRPVVAIISIDNYEELMKDATDSEKSSILADIDKKISEWTKESRALLRKYDRDKYVFVLEENDFAKLQQKKFSVLERASDSEPCGRSGDSVHRYRQGWRELRGELEKRRCRAGYGAVARR